MLTKATIQTKKWRYNIPLLFVSHSLEKTKTPQTNPTQPSHNSEAVTTKRHIPILWFTACDRLLHPELSPGQDRTALHRHKQDSGEINPLPAFKIYIYRFLKEEINSLKESDLSLFSLPPFYYSSQVKALPKVCTSLHRFAHLCAQSPTCPAASKPASQRAPPAPALHLGIPKQTPSNLHLPRSCLITQKALSHTYHTCPQPLGVGPRETPPDNCHGEKVGFSLKEVFMMFASSHERSL